jgi:hypothetical protein
VANFVKATILASLANDLNDFGEWEITAGGFLERQFFKAMADLWKAYTWPFRFATGTITTTVGTLGPYSVPSDFQELAFEEKLNKYYAYDNYSVQPPIADGLLGRRYEISFDRVNNKINFFIDPGAGSRTFLYLKKLVAVGDVEGWEYNADIENFLLERAAHWALSKTEDFREQAKEYFEKSEMMLIREVKRRRKHASRPDTRTLLDANGNPMYYNFQGLNHD